MQLTEFAMMLFCTILYVNGLPVDYCIYNKETNVFDFEPVFNPHSNLEAPEFKIIERKGAWMPNKLLEINLRDQAIEALNEYLQKQ